MKGYKTKIIKIFFIYLTLTAVITSCEFSKLSPLESTDSVENTEDVGDGSDVVTDPTPPRENPDEVNDLVSGVEICSDLDLDGIKWPSDLSSIGIDLYSLALNITGSFEGFSDFQNIANNFDGQGLSLGIFQQNLGQGTLQPLLLQAQDMHSQIFRDHFTFSQRSGLNKMLEDWVNNDVTPVSRGLASLSTQNAEEFVGNHLDVSEFSSGLNFGTFMASNARNAESVDWAVSNLYLANGKTFAGTWKQNLQSFAGDQRYVSLQVNAGRYLHDKAMRFMNQYEARELRSYLFFFDIAVQNGGIQTSVRNKYLEHIQNNPGLTELERMVVLLEFRLERVLNQFKEDVRARKMTVLTSEGRVHGRDRDLQEEYCVETWDVLVR